MTGHLDPTMLESETRRMDQVFERLHGMIRSSERGRPTLPRLEIPEDVGQPGTKCVRSSSPAGT
ncbi:MAG: hypothetical protein N2039_03460 [Gemmataceae bacterium]|nr:hypothetical protein [Gemmataceae bacterium]